MVEGKTGLNVKDYPFAFSVAALFFPNLLVDGSNNASVLGILLIGGMLRSLLTIINPVSLAIKHHYTRTYSNIIYHMIFPDMFPAKNKLIIKIIEKNFKAALSSPPISFETDKTVAMLYFIFILTLTLIRSFMDDFTSLLSQNPYLIFSIRVGAVAGLFGVILVLLHHHFGGFKTEKFEIKFAKFKRTIIQQTSISHFDRICYVTIANLAIDFANLTNEIQKWKKSGLDNQPLREGLLKEFSKFDKTVTNTLSDKFSASYADFEEYANKEIKKLYSEKNYSLNQGTIQNLYQKYKSIKEISFRYDIEFDEVLAWMHDPTFSLEGLYDIETQLRASIESRDWYNASLVVYRITDMLEIFLQQKNIPESITNR